MHANITQFEKFGGLCDCPHVCHDWRSCKCGLRHEPRATSPAPAQRNRQHQLSVYSRELKTKLKYPGLTVTVLPTHSKKMHERKQNFKKEKEDY